MSVAIIDYGMCNLGSVRRAFEECGAEVIMASHPAEIMKATHIVLPGVGAYTKGMENLRARGWVDIIRQRALEDKIPFLGICLGMQLLSDFGIEGGKTEGLSLISGKVEKIIPTENEFRIPHVGWNEISFSQTHPLLKQIETGTDYYFVHSFRFVVDVESSLLATTPYCGSVSSIVACENIMGVQFHPEKSGKPGFRLIRNFLEI